MPKTKAVDLNLTSPRSLASILFAIFDKQAFITNNRTSLFICKTNWEIEEVRSILKFLYPNELDILEFPDLETTPYERINPTEDLIVKRLLTLYHLNNLQFNIQVKDKPCLVLTTTNALAQKLIPKSFIEKNILILHRGLEYDLTAFVNSLDKMGYNRTSTIFAPGDFSVKGSTLDVFPLNSEHCLRLDFFDNELENLQLLELREDSSLTFIKNLDEFKLLPSKEFILEDFNLDANLLEQRLSFEAEIFQASLVNKSLKNRSFIAGLESYLPLLHQEELISIFDYLPEDALIFRPDNLDSLLDEVNFAYQKAYDSSKYDVDFPALDPDALIFRSEEVFSFLKQFTLSKFKFAIEVANEIFFNNFNASFNLPLASNDLSAVKNLTKKLSTGQKILISVNSLGRAESVANLLSKQSLDFIKVANLPNLIAQLDASQIFLSLVQADSSFIFSTGTQIKAEILVLTEADLFANYKQTRNKATKSNEYFEDAIKSLSELEEGDLIVHKDKGIGRFKGLQTLDLKGHKQQFLALEYADAAILYIPVSDLDLIAPYRGLGNQEFVSLSKLGLNRWDKNKQLAHKKAQDVAADLLKIYAKRQKAKGFSFVIDETKYQEFSASFNFIETEDQTAAIYATLDDMQKNQPMDRLICGDVGFGKTEVALRAAFVAVANQKQVAILVPTTLLASQQFDKFIDRLAATKLKTLSASLLGDEVVRIESLSRFKSAKEEKQIKQDLSEGLVDIVIGTHKLLAKDISFKNLGLIIVDEEHRFGIMQKDKLKKLRISVDILSMTATPIPRSLNFALNKLRDLSIIASPPSKRLEIKTFVSEFSDELVLEATNREFRRGGQVFFLHNDVVTMDKLSADLQKLLPKANIRFAHGQMPQAALKQTMRDFYNQKFNLLVCSTIIETGIDIPTANTIIINKANKFGLAQLHQLRGRVGRSHHQAYAYLFSKPNKLLNRDAIMRLLALERHTSLGSGFNIASQDLEIRGAGELLGKEQSGHIQSIGLDLYNEMLAKAINTLEKVGMDDESDAVVERCEVDLNLDSLIPDEYIDDVNLRLYYYQLISKSSLDELDNIRAQLIDKFSLMPTTVKVFFLQTEIRTKLGMVFKTIELKQKGWQLTFQEQAKFNLDKLIKLISKEPKKYSMMNDKSLLIKLDYVDFLKPNAEQKKDDIYEVEMLKKLTKCEQELSAFFAEIADKHE